MDNDPKILFVDTGREITERSDFDRDSSVSANDLGEDWGDGFFVDPRFVLIQRDDDGAIARTTPLDEIPGVDLHPAGGEDKATPVKLSRKQREDLRNFIATRLFKYYDGRPQDDPRYNPLRDGLPEVDPKDPKALSSTSPVFRPASRTEVFEWCKKVAGERADLVDKRGGDGGYAADVAIRISRNPC